VADALRALRRAHATADFQRRHGDLLLRLEKAPDQVAPGVLRAALQTIFRRSQVNGVSVAVPIRRGEVARLAADLDVLEAADPDVLAVPGSDLARLAIIGGTTAAGASAWWPHLLLSGRFDGELHGYLPKLAKALGPRAGDIWGRTVGFPTGGPDELAAWLERHRLPSRIFFTARQEPVDRVGEAVLDHEEALAMVSSTQGRSWAERRAALAPLLLRSDGDGRQPPHEEGPERP
jgi:hypothetical protein